MPKKPTVLTPPVVAIFAAQKSCGKTHMATFLADALALNGYPFHAFQIDDQNKLSHMIATPSRICAPIPTSWSRIRR